MSLPALALCGGSVPNYGCLSITERVPGLPIVLPGWGYPCANFLGFGAVVFWGLRVRCGRVKDVSSSLGCIWGVSADLRMPTHNGECTWATHSLNRLGRPLRKFLGSGAVVSWGLWVRCGRVKDVSSSLGFVWGSVPNYGCLPIRGGASGLTILLSGWGDPCANFLVARYGSFLGFWGPVR